MTDADSLLARFHGGDPIEGRQALQGLLAMGDAGEAALFAQPIVIRTMQGLRRWHGYVATRPATCETRLLERVCENHPRGGAYHEAELLAALPRADQARERVGRELAAMFRGGTPALSHDDVYWRVCALLHAWGALGGDAFWPWRLVSEDDYAWEKLRIQAFRAACLAAARSGGQHLSALAEFVTHAWPRHSGLVTISDNPARYTDDMAIDSAELWLQAHYQFSRWRSGDLVDGILQQWSGHPHWRVRDFGAQVLGALGFRRAARPLAAWLQRESVPRVRDHVLGALGRSDSAIAADALLAEWATTQARQAQQAKPSEALRAALAEVGWQATDRAAAGHALQSITADSSTDSAEAMVALARLGARAPQLDAALEAPDHYARLNAALAIGRLGETGRAGDLRRQLSETAGRLEPVYFCAALALLRAPGSADELHRRLVAMSTARDSLDSPEEVFRLKRPLQQAVLDALRAAEEPGRATHDAWAAEMEPLDIHPAPVPVAAGSAAPERRPATMAPVAVAAVAPHDLFISHASEDKATIVRPLHDALVAAGLRVWLDDLQLTLGDSLRRRIDDGLAHSRFGVVVLSPAFFAKAWPQRELDALFARESALGRKTILPILHGMGVQALASTAPLLADRKMISSDAGLAAVVAAIVAAVRADRSA